MVPKTLRWCSMCVIVCMLLVHGMLVKAHALEEAICARVRIQLSQDVVIARNAFKGTLEITNAPENVPLENLRVTLNITDGNNLSANNLFGINPPELSGVGDVNGGGVIQPGTTAIASWLLVPAHNAAPDGPVMYYVGGEFSYTQAGSSITVPLFPAPILVKPDPLLVLDYFWAKDVNGDDPLTSEIEPVEPFSLGLMVRNNGKGVANDFRIISSEPQIIENEKGLLADFRIIGTQVSENLISPSLTVNLGNIDPGTKSIAQWIMTSSLQGTFSDYKADFVHIDGLGNPQLSLIDAVNIHELTHVVRVDTPSDDNIPDFLAKDGGIYNVYISDNVDSGVVDQSGSSTLTFAAQKGFQSVYTLKTTPGSGFIYVQLPDPFDGQDVITSVVRSDGKIIRSENSWLSKTRVHSDPWQYFFNLFDADSTGTYTVTLKINIDTTAPQTPSVLDEGRYSFVADQIAATWGSKDAESGLSAAEYCIGTRPGFCDIIVWEPIPLDGSIQATGLSLGYNQTYYVNVRTKNGAGIWSEEGSSNGITILDPSGDSDGDGNTNEMEVASKSDPLNRFSYPGAGAAGTSRGFNLISLQGDLAEILDEDNPTAYRLLQLLGGSDKITRIQKIESALGLVREALYEGNVPAGEDFVIEPGDGLIVYSKADAVIPFTSVVCRTLDLYIGNNLIGLPCAAPGMTAFQLLRAIGGEMVISSVGRYNRNTGEFETASYHNGAPVGVDFSIIPGEGYFITMHQSVSNIHTEILSSPDNQWGECVTDADCIITGCSGQVCASQPVITTCEWREEYACYHDPNITTCGCNMGICGWAQTPELALCLVKAQGP